MTHPDPLDRFFCVFYAEQDPALYEPVATFDRMTFLHDFIKSLWGKVEFRETNHDNDILTVADWKALRDK